MLEVAPRLCCHQRIEAREPSVWPVVKCVPYFASSRLVSSEASVAPRRPASASIHAGVGTDWKKEKGKGKGTLVKVLSPRHCLVLHVTAAGYSMLLGARISILTEPPRPMVALVEMPVTWLGLRTSQTRFIYTRVVSTVLMAHINMTPTKRLLGG